VQFFTAGYLSNQLPLCHPGK